MSELTGSVDGPEAGAVDTGGAVPEDGMGFMRAAISASGTVWNPD
ncbi:MAG: hypothetical protein ACR2NZ_21065 [Rubripirellula sp.]